MVRAEISVQKLKMEKHSWPVKATSHGVEGYEVPKEPYEDSSEFMKLTSGIGKPGYAVCMASFGTLGICLQCVQTLLATTKNFGYTEITFKVCRVEKSAKFEYEKSHIAPARENQSLKLKMCMHHDEIKLTFTWHWDTLAIPAAGTVAAVPASTGNVQTLHECVVSVEELAKMTYLSPSIEVPKDPESDESTKLKLTRTYPFHSLHSLIKSRESSGKQAHISFMGPLTLTYAAAQADAEHYYVCSVSKHVIGGITQPLKLIDGMTDRLRPESDQVSGLKDAQETRKSNLIRFDNNITSWMGKNQDHEESLEAETIASLPKGSQPQKINKYTFEYEISKPKPLGGRPEEDGMMSHALPNGLVFHDEMHLCSIPECTHRPWPSQG